MARNNLCVGVDIGASSVKLCQLKATKAGYALEQFAQAALPPDTLVDGAIMSGSRVLEGLQSVLSQCKVRSKRVAVSISGRSMIIKTVALPQMKRDELDRAAQKEIAQYIPFDLADVYLDMQIVGPNSDQKGRMDVLLVAAKKEFVNDYTAVLAEAGLKAEVCDIDAFAVQTFFENTHGVVADSTIGLCNLGAVKTNFNVLDAGKSKFTRDLEWGASLLTAEIQKFYGISYEEAEAIKVEQRPLPPDLEAAMQRVAELISGELLRTIDFYASSHGDAAPSCLYLCGGGANDPRVTAAIKQTLALPIHTMDMRRRIVVPSEWDKPFAKAGLGAALAAGLALRYAGDG